MTSTEVQFEEMIARIKPYYNSSSAADTQEGTRLKLIAATVVRETLPDEVAAVEMLEHLAGQGISAQGHDSDSPNWYETCVGLVATALCRYFTAEDPIAA